MSKKSLLALLLAAVMVLSGCSLVMKDQEVDNLLTIIDVNGTLVNKQVFNNTYDYNLYIEQYYASMLASFGGDGSVDPQKVLEDTIAGIITSIVSNQKCTELGLYQLTAEEEAQVKADGQAAYDEELEYIKEYYFADSELTGADFDAAIAEQALATGITLEAMTESTRSTFISERLRASVTDLVTITDEDIQTELDSLIAEEKASYENNLAAYGLAANGTSADIYYTPAGYRSVKIIEIAKPTEEGAEDTAKAEIEALAARIAAGEAFDTLSDSISAKVVCESSTDLDTAVVEAAMLLADAGSVSPVIETENGYALVQYVEDVAEKTATLEEVRDALYDTVLANAQDAAYDEAVNAWIEAADVKIYTENLNN